MYEEVEKRFSKTIKLTKVLTYLFLFLSLIISLYFIITLSISNESFKMIKSSSRYILSFDKSFSLPLSVDSFVDDFMNIKTKIEIKFIYSYIILRTLIIMIFMNFIMYNILKVFRYSSLKKTPFNKDVIKYVDIIKWLIIGLAILPNIIKCIFRYLLIRKDIVVFDNVSFLIPIFIALFLNVIKHIFLYGIELQNEYDSLV